MVEMMIGVAIVAVLLAAAAPNFSVWIQNSKVRGAAESVLTGIQLARSEAVRRNTPVYFELRPAGSPNLLWKVGCVTVVAASSAVACPDLIQGRDVAEGGLLLSSGQLAATLSVAAGSRIIYDNFGSTTTPDFTQLNVDSSVLSAADSRTLRIVIAVGGSARMCDPHLVSPNVLACP